MKAQDLTIKLTLDTTEFDAALAKCRRQLVTALREAAEVEGHGEVERLRDALRRLTFAVEQEHGASYRQLIIDAHAAMNAEHGPVD